MSQVVEVSFTGTYEGTFREFSIHAGLQEVKILRTSGDASHFFNGVGYCRKDFLKASVYAGLRGVEKFSIEKNSDGQFLPISAVRGGIIVGEHEVISAGQNEVIEFRHTAYSRAICGRGQIPGGSTCRAV